MSCADGSRGWRAASLTDAASRLPRVAYLSARERWRALLRRRLERRLVGPRLLRAFAGDYPQAFFIEIGANDGELADPVRPFIVAGGWSGIMVEPVPYVFERLRRNYAGFDRVALENVAIADRDGRLPFYHLAEVEDPAREGVPAWYTAVGSFSREHVLDQSDVPDAERLIVRREVPCMTFESLCRKHNVERVDLLLIDTEGYDYEIIKRIDLEARRPRVLVYEHTHLSREDREECRRLLTRLGYDPKEEYLDTWCLDSRPDDRLTRRWRRMRPAIPGVPR